MSVVLAITFIFCIIIARLFYVQVIWGSELVIRAADQWNREIPVVASRGRMFAVLLAPAMLVTAAVAALALVAGCPVLAALLAGIHLSGCSGDILMAAAALHEGRCTHVRDTDTGIELLAEGNQ